MTLTCMEKEARDAPALIQKQFACNHAGLSELVRHIRHYQPKMVLTIARGSSDHAATFAKYLFETRNNLITGSLAPSVFTLYKTNLSVKNCLVLAISQSGQSPDIAEVMSVARMQGAMTVAIVNQLNSPLASSAEYVIPMHAGDEKAVAATKTYLMSLAALLQLSVLLNETSYSAGLLEKIPDFLCQSIAQNWLSALGNFKNCHNTLVIGRGYSFPIAQEAALKFKETSHIHAEALSGAELMHGPLTLVKLDLPIFVFAQQDETQCKLLEICERMKAMGARISLVIPETSQAAARGVADQLLLTPASFHPLADVFAFILNFYLFVAPLSVARGFNPDSPDHLSKVTCTW